jgi:hypothetical protein
MSRYKVGRDVKRTYTSNDMFEIVAETLIGGIALGVLATICFILLTFGSEL